MELFFNNAGPCIPEDHYMIDPLRRIDHERVEDLIAEKRYFVLHAPRQTGKTSCLLALMHHLNAQGHYQALYANIEQAQAAHGNVKRGIAPIVESISSSAEHYLNNPSLLTWLKTNRQDYSAEFLLQALLKYWSTTTDKPTVLFLDEIDALVGDTLISVLRQIRAGYAQRPQQFPLSIVLCGVRDVRDYRIETQHKDCLLYTSPSPRDLSTSRMPSSA